MEVIRWYAIALLWILNVASGQHCTSSRPNVIKFSLKSFRNATGHWNAQAELKHGANFNESGPWEVDIEHITENCEHFETIVLLADISGIPAAVTSHKSSGPQQNLRPDYELIPGLGQYKFHPEVKTWFQAKDTCEQEGAHLAVINSQREANALLHFWVPHPKIYNDWRNEWAHIGFHDQYVEGEYVTIFGDHLNATGYSNWYPGQPNTGVIENCGVADRKSSLLADVGCTVELPFFCELEHQKLNPANQDPESQVTTLPDYNFLPKLGYYKLHSELKSWAEAVRTCNLEGTHLLVIDSDEEISAVQEIWRREIPPTEETFHNKWMHVGYHDYFHEGIYTDILGNPMNFQSSTLMQWGTNSPEGGTMYNCVKMGRDSLLDDEKCTNELPFFCEKKL